MATIDHPQRLGKYEILSVLGKGGMGIVYRARDAVIDRIVAIKTITTAAEGIDQNQVARLLMEARSAGRLHHPNIVTVFDYGEENGIAYIVMEYAEGVDLAQVITSGQQLALPTKIDILLQICNGLGFAHDAGVVHRDMKPSNVRLTPQGVAKILDFGLARYDDTHLTKTGFISGTIAYMSPERMNGQTGQSDDIFALGAIAYELLTYQRAFPGNAAPEVMFKIMTQTPPRPSSVAEVPPQFDDIVLKCLDREAENRYHSPQDFAAAIEESLASPEVQAFMSSEERSEAFRQGLKDWATARKIRRTHASGSGSGSSSGKGSIRVTDTPTMSEMRPMANSTDATSVIASTPAAGSTSSAPPAGTADKGISASLAAVTMIGLAPGTDVKSALPPTSVDIPAGSPPTEIVAVPRGKSPAAKIAAIAAAAVVIGAVATVIVRKQPAPEAVAPTSSGQPPVVAAPSTAAPAPAGIVTDVNVNVQKAQWELQQLSTRLQVKLDAAKSRGGIPLSDSRWEDLLSDIAELRSSADSGDFMRVRTEGDRILRRADEIIRKPESRPPSVAVVTPTKPRPQPSSAAATPTPQTPTPSRPLPAPTPQQAAVQPAETRPAPPSPAPQSLTDPRGEINSFMRRVASAYQNRDTGFFRDHHAAYNDRMGNAIKGSPSVRVQLDVEAVDIRDADHARVVVQRVDELPGGAPPQRVRLAYVIERDGSSWKIIRTERP
ncbi:MAG TPA: serine/threonine-protein kinase [Thermoanaerobaculia bacterium]|nr:serine/threonine-protein kinase [Thermoanaerobaculia bacterium]